jgi:hemolysin III
MHRWHLLEDVANSVTHGIGFLLSVAALVVLVTRAAPGGPWYLVSAGLYGGSLVLLYLVSTIYHSLIRTRAEGVLERLDRSAIYLLILGTYVPFVFLAIRGPLGWGLFGTLCALAIAGILLTVLFLKKFASISSALYLCMGWLIVLALHPLLRHLSLQTVLWLLAGGIAYTGGVVFFLSGRRFHHTVWHLAVLAGSVCHFLAVLAVVSR